MACKVSGIIIVACAISGGYRSATHRVVFNQRMAQGSVIYFAIAGTFTRIDTG